MSNSEVLIWLHNRLLYMHGENYSTDYMHHLRRIICQLENDKPAEKIKMGIFSKNDNDPATPMDFTFDLLATVRDKITGFEGAVVARTQWASNCNNYMIKPCKLSDKGEMIKAETIDENRLELVVPVVEKPMQVERARGGPTDEIKDSNAFE